MRARAQRSADEVLVTASSDEDSMDIEMTDNPSDGLSSTLSRGKGRARGRARGARGQNSTARGSSRRGRGKKILQSLYCSFRLFFSLKGDSLLMLPSSGNLLHKNSTGKKALLKYLWYPIAYNWQGLSCDFFTVIRRKISCFPAVKHSILLKDALLGRSVL